MLGKFMEIASPAKINLFLHLRGRRDDGYHEIETLICPIGLEDRLVFENNRTGAIELQAEGVEIPTGPDNLICRAARLLQEATGCEGKGARIRVHKTIPVGGGLAGGSGNAAITLRALNQMWDCGLPLQELEKLAAKLGSDIAFFLHESAAICSGRGELVEPVGVRGLNWVMLVNPGFGVSTPWAYKTYAGNPGRGEPGKLSLSYVDKGGAEHPFALRNDLEPPVFSKYLWIAEAKNWLQQQSEVEDALMSGSGATVFALLPSEAAGKDLQKRAVTYFGEKAFIRVVRLGTNGHNAPTP
jgi:4-diphosphocytidyl-2-C-methyl-D-erythritol kinase